MADSTLSADDVKKIAKLANLQLSEEEITTYQSQLSHILSYIDQLQELDTKDIPQTAQITGLENVTRVIDGFGIRTLTSDVATSQAPKVHNHYIQVPQILQNRDE